MREILLVEDDPTLGTALTTTLSLEGLRPHLVTTLAAAREAMEAHLPDLVVLDLGLPDGDGMELCREARAKGWTVPILVLTARGMLHARVDGLREGADDYVTKPFDLPELVARIDALLRRSAIGSPPRSVTLGRLQVDLRAHTATCDGEPIELTALEMKLLRYLFDRRGKVVTREALLEGVWGVRPETRTRTVDMFVLRLRRLIEEDPAEPKILTSVRGLGYRLEPVGGASRTPR